MAHGVFTVKPLAFDEIDDRHSTITCVNPEFPAAWVVWLTTFAGYYVLLHFCLCS